MGVRYCRALVVTVFVSPSFFLVNRSEGLQIADS